MPGLITTGELALFNTLLDAAQIGAVDSFAELAEIARIVEAIMAIAAGGNANPALTAADFELIGITGLDADSVDDMVRLMATTADSGSGVDTIGELQAISVAAQAAAATAAALDLISNYDGTNQASLAAGAITATGVTVGGVTETATVTQTVGSYNSKNVASANTVTAAFYRGKDDQVSNGATSTLILANEYALSKRTTVYGQVAFANADAAAGLRTSVVAGGTAADKNTRVLNVGIKHAF